jgi:hypothetical protein
MVGARSKISSSIRRATGPAPPPTGRHGWFPAKRMTWKTTVTSAPSRARLVREICVSPTFKTRTARAQSGFSAGTVS